MVTLCMRQACTIALDNLGYVLRSCRPGDIVEVSTPVAVTLIGGGLAALWLPAPADVPPVESVPEPEAPKRGRGRPRKPVEPTERATVHPTEQK
jgi:hypothetical protein